MRQVASLIAGAAVGALGGLVLGEYPFTGWTPYVAGVLFALVVTEVMLSISRRHGPVLGVGGGVFSAGGLGWAVWISSGRGIEPIPGGGWIAIALGLVVAMVRGFLPSRRKAPAPPAPRQPETPSPLDLLDEFIAPPASATIVGPRTVRLLDREGAPAEPGGLPASEERGTDSDAPTAEGASKAMSKAVSKAGSKGSSEPASKRASQATPRTGTRTTSESAKKAPAKKVPPKKVPAKKVPAKKVPATSAIKTSRGAGKSATAGKPAKATVKKAKSPAPRSRTGER